VNKFFGGDRLGSLISWEISPTSAGRFELEAKRDGSKLIEAEHMLLALAADLDSDAGKLLNEAGLDHARLASALKEEHERTLAFAGISARSFDLVKATELESRLSFGTSAKAAFRRALIGSRHDRRRARLRSMDLLAGILEAELGTVPRVLAIAGIDRTELIARARGSELTSQKC
jgi:ATP-dependent Clp protease ATP-binding subunit ClpA